MTARAPRDRSAAVLGLAPVVLANLAYFTGLGSILEPQMGMDPLYISLARGPVAGILTQDPAWGPLYGLWFVPLVALLGDPIAVYSANLLALSLAISSLLFVYVFLLTRRAAPAVLLALFFIVSDLNVPLAGKVSAFALLVILAGLATAEVLPPGVPRLAATTIATLLAAYARPELYPAAIGLCGLVLVTALRQRRRRGARILVWPAVCLALFGLAWAAIGSPLFTPAPGEGRLLAAFREHFAWNWIAWSGRPAYYLDIWRQAFGQAQSVGQALASNPGAVAHHLVDNLLGTITFMARRAFAHYPLLAPVTWPALVWLESAAASAVVFGALLIVAVRPLARRDMARRYGHLLVPYALIAASCLGSAVLVFPLARYLLIPAILLMIGGALAVAHLVPVAAPWSWRGRVAASAVCLIAVPRPFVLPSAYRTEEPRFRGRITVTRPLLETLALIRSLRLAPPVRVLTFTDGVGEMLGPGFLEVKVWQKGAQSLEEYVRDQRIDVIVTLETGRDSFLVDDPYWARLRAAPGEAGFVLLPAPSADPAPAVYVRADRLAAADDGRSPPAPR